MAAAGSAPHGALRYRPDIDGLRACAIVPILLLHSGFYGLRGGFTGVDIFFVISGYLITGILAREIASGDFSVLAFYRRRFVRILPALLAMLAVTLAVGCFMLLPAELIDLGRSAAATATFVSNVYFWQTADYFAAASNTKPLIHTWSLGVEEQFYILYPPLLLLLQRLAPQRRIAGLALIAVLSFAGDLWAAFHAPSAGFFLFPGRIWELALGGLVALGAAPAIANRMVRSLLSVLALVALAAGFVAISGSWPFPAPFALVPAGATAVLIAYGEATPTDRLLSSRPLRWIGLLSYSLYLWHRPIIALHDLCFGATLLARDTPMLIAATFVVAVPSYYLIERPVLARWRTGPVGPIVATSLATILLFAAAGLAMAANADRLRPLPPDIGRVANYIGYDKSRAGIAQFRTGRCFEISASAPFDAADCLALASDRPNVVLMGDSHAAQFWQALDGRLVGARLLQATAAGCRPLLHARGAGRCIAIDRLVFDGLVPTGRVATVILAGRWLPSEVPQLIETIAYLRGRAIQVIVIGPMVEYDLDMPAVLAWAMLRHDPASIDRFRRPDRQALDTLIGPLVHAAGAAYLSAAQEECPHGHCAVSMPDGTPIHFDTSHLTLPASIWMLRGLPPIPSTAPR